MKKRISTLILMVLVAVGFSTSAQTTYNVPADSTLNEFIANNNDTTGLSTYVLERDGYYVLTGSIGFSGDLAIVAEDGDGRRPVITFGTTDEGGSSGWGMFYNDGDLILKSLELNTSNIVGARGVWANALMNNSGVGATIELDDCVVEYYDGAGVWNESGDELTVILRNNVFRYAGVSDGGKWQGFTCLLKNGSLENLIVENNTFYEVYTSMFIHENGHVKNAFFNHNTIVSIGQGPFRLLFADRMLFMNNLIIDGHFGGERLADLLAQDNDQQPMGVYSLDYYRSDTLKPEAYPAEADRVNLVAYNANYVTPELKAYWAGYTEADSFVVADVDRFNGFMNERTYEMLTSAGDYDYPYFKWDDTHSVYTDDPALSTFTVKTDDEIEISKQMNGFEATVNTENGTWGRYPEADGNAGYPLAKDYYTFEYNNMKYQSSAYKGYPIGDLNWFPTEKAAWEAEKEDYDAIVSSVLDGSWEFKDQSVGIFSQKDNSNINNAVSVFPNPSNGLATVSVELEKAGMVKVDIYNLFGKKVRDLEPQQVAAGTHITNIDLSDLASGSYLVKVTTNGKTGSSMLVVE